MTFARMSQLHDARGPRFLRHSCPSFPFAEVRLFQKILVAHDISFDGQVSTVNLYLACYHQPILGSGLWVFDLLIGMSKSGGAASVS